MKMFSCDKCSRWYDKRSYERHMQNVYECDNLSDIKVELFTCKICKKQFNKKANYLRHINNENSRCCAMKQVDEKLETMEKKIEKLTNNVINNNTLNQTLNQTVINNIKQEALFYEHGKESIDHITREILLELLDNNSFSDVCSDLMKLLYFNINVPKNSNWMIAYPKNGKAGVEFNYDTHQFERKSTIDIIDDKFANMINLLQPLIEKLCREDERDNILNKKQKRNVNRFFEHVGMLEISKESPDVYVKIHEMAYNYRSIATTSWKDQGFNGNHLSIKF